jgi:hypothetical protein
MPVWDSSGESRLNPVPPYLDVFWEEDDDLALCKSPCNDFEVNLPIPRGVPFLNIEAHQRVFGE